MPHKADSLLQPLIPQLIDQHKARAANDPEFIYTLARIELNRAMQEREYLPLNESKRRAAQEEFEAKLLAMENSRRTALGEELLTELDKEDPLAESHLAPADDDQDDDSSAPFLAETGHILIDLLELQRQVASTH